MEQYFSFGKQEFRAIRQLRDCDWRVYCCLREKADFKTGRLEHPTSLKMTAASIARDISLPGQSGIPALEFSRKDVERSLSRLEVLGFIDEREREGRFIRLRMPMVATNTAKSEPSQTRVTQKSGQGDSKNTTRVTQIETAETVVAQGFRESDDARVTQETVPGCRKESARVTQTENTEIAETQVGQGITGGQIVPFSTVFSTKKPQYSPLPPTGGEENPLPSASEKSKTTPLAADGGLQEAEKTEIQRLRTVVANAAKKNGGVIRCLKSERSTEVLAGWVGRFKDWEIEEACGTVIAKADVMNPYVDSIDTLIRQQAAKLAKFRLSYCAG